MTVSEAAMPPGAGAPALRKGLILFILGISQLMIILDGTIVNVALNSIRNDLVISSLTSLQWIVTGYALTFGGFLLLGGKLADRIGRRTIFMAGLVLFGIASLAGGLANSLGVLITARAVQGAGGAMMAPAALSILTVVFAEGKERDRAFGVWAAISAGGAALGLILGGVLTEYANWRWVFFVNVPIAAFAIFGAMRFVPESRHEEAKGFDVFGAVLVTAGLSTLVYALVNLNNADWATGTKIGVVAAALVLLVSFVVIQARIRWPLLPLGLFRYRNLSGANLGGILVGAGLFSVFLYLVLWMQQVNGWTPLQSGFAFLPFTVGIIIGAGFSTVMMSRVGPRPLLTIGPILTGLGMLALSFWLKPDLSYVALLLPTQLIMSIGLGITFPALVSSAVAGVPQEHSGIASGLLNAAQQVGGAVGLALLTAVSTGRTNTLTEGMALGPNGFPVNPAEFPVFLSATVDGWTKALLVGAILIFSAAVIMTSIVRATKDDVQPGMGMG